MGGSSTGSGRAEGGPRLKEENDNRVFDTVTSKRHKTAIGCYALIPRAAQIWYKIKVKHSGRRNFGKGDFAYLQSSRFSNFKNISKYRSVGKIKELVCHKSGCEVDMYCAVSDEDEAFGKPT